MFFLIEVSELYPKAACVENEIHFSKHILDLVILGKGTCPAFVICDIFFLSQTETQPFPTATLVHDVRESPLKS